MQQVEEATASGNNSVSPKVNLVEEAIEFAGRPSLGGPHLRGCMKVKTQLESISKYESIARTSSPHMSSSPDAAGGPSLRCVKDNGAGGQFTANSFQVPTGVPAWPRSNAQHGNSSGNSSAFMSVLNESMGSFSIGSSSISLMEDSDTHLMSENMSSPDAAGGPLLWCIKDNGAAPSFSMISTSCLNNLGTICFSTNAVVNEEVAVLPPREWVAGKSSGNSSEFNMSVMNESLMTFSTFQSIGHSEKHIENDILFGRGGHTIWNPGSIRFRAKALELRSRYEACGDSKELFLPKIGLSEDLVDCMKAEDRRFLEMGPDKLYYELVGNDVMKKVSQALTIFFPTNAVVNEEVAVLPCELVAGKSSGNSSEFNMSVMNESLMTFSTFQSIGPSENDTFFGRGSFDELGGVVDAVCDGDDDISISSNAMDCEEIQDVNATLTAWGNNSVSPKVNLVEEAIDFASSINPENLPIRSYDANGTLIDVQWQGEANALDTFHDDPTFRNVVSQQNSILRSGLTPTFSKLSTSFNNIGMISVPTNAAANEEKKKSKRVIDFSTPLKPTEDDILFGRGGDINKHPGNIRFRAKARELAPSYEAYGDSKEEKYKVSVVLVDCMKAENRRFLEKGPDGLWYKVLGNCIRKKASQALREKPRRHRVSTKCNT